MAFGTVGLPPDGRSYVADDARLEVAMDAEAGRLRVSDARLFGPDGCDLGRRLVEALCSRPGVRRAEFDPRDATCRVEFDLGLDDPREMAAAFVDALREASARAGRRRRPWRRVPRWCALVGFRHHGAVSAWETYDDGPGRLRLVHEAPPGGRRGAVAVADAIAGVAGVTRCDVSLWSRRMTVAVDLKAAPSFRRTVGRVEAVLEGRPALSGPGAGDGAGDGRPAPEVFRGLKRLAYLAMGGGAFVLALVGVAVPGVPTVPFLLASSYALARSSPALDARLRRTAFFGPILREWETRSGLSAASKLKLGGFTVSVIAVTVLVAPLGPVALGVILLVSSVTIYGIVRVPSVAADDAPDALPAGPASTPALAPPAP